MLNRILSKFGYVKASANNVVNDGDSHWWTGVSNWMADTVAGEVVTESNVLTSSTCFACTKVLSETVAGLPSSIMKVLKDRREEMKSHSAIDILCESPNSEMDSFTFMEMVVSRLTNAGNFYAEIQRDGRDRPIALWPIHPSRVEPIREPDGSLIWQVSGDYTGSPNYSDPSWTQQNLRFLSNRDMLNVVGPLSKNGIIGPGISPGASEIGIDFAVRRYGADFFRHGAAPLGFVEHPTFISDDTKRANFRNDINKLHSAQRHQVGVLWEGAKYNQIGISPEQAQMLETRRYTAHQLCYMYGVPPPIIGDLEDSKFATADSAIRFFVMMTIRNLVERIERAFNRQVMKTRSGGRLVHAFDDKTIYRMVLDGLLRGDPKAQAETWKLYREMGAATANDILRDLDMNPIDGEEGEYRLVPGGYTRLDKIDEQGNRPANAVKDSADKKAEEAKERLIAMIEPMAEPAKATVQGFDPTATVKQSIRIVAKSAVERINAITVNQIERWREQDPAIVQTKLGEFFVKQSARLSDALEPADALANSINLDPISGLVAETYLRKSQTLDSHTVFDKSKSCVDPESLLCEFC
jgi:HK97 family phage portal protein